MLHKKGQWGHPLKKIDVSLAKHCISTQSENQGTIFHIAIQQNPVRIKIGSIVKGIADLKIGESC